MVYKLWYTRRSTRFVCLFKYGFQYQMATICKGIYQILQSHFKTSKSYLSKEIDNLEEQLKPGFRTTNRSQSIPGPK